MTLPAEGLRNAGIASIFFKDEGGITAMVRMLRIFPQHIAAEASRQLPERGTLCIAADGNAFEIPVSVRAAEDGKDGLRCEIHFDGGLPAPLAEKLNEMQKLCLEANRRREERYEVGMTGHEQFGLHDSPCILSCNGRNISCVIVNVSVHGALLMGEKQAVRSGSACMLSLAFSDGTHAALHATVLEIRDADHFGKSLYPLRLAAPVPLSWQKKVLAYGAAS